MSTCNMFLWRNKENVRESTTHRPPSESVNFSKIYRTFILLIKPKKPLFSYKNLYICQKGLLNFMANVVF